MYKALCAKRSRSAQSPPHPALSPSKGEREFLFSCKGRPISPCEGGLSIVIAVDGTAASGKGTLAKLLARHFHFAHLDSGSLYRLVALAVQEAGGDIAKEEHAVKAAHAIDLTRAGEPAIRTDAIGKAASRQAASGTARRPPCTRRRSS